MSSKAFKYFKTPFTLSRAPETSSITMNASNGTSNGDSILHSDASLNPKRG